MKGTKIIVSEHPRGVFLEGYIDDASKPGTVMQIKAATAAIANLHRWQAYNVDADGNQRLIAVLLEKEQEGKIYSDAYVAGDSCHLYCPAPGEDLNMLVANIAGTADSFAIGDLLMVDDGTGKLVATTGTPESEPFIVLETVAALTADSWVWCKHTGY